MQAESLWSLDLNRKLKTSHIYLSLDLEKSWQELKARIAVTRNSNLLELDGRDADIRVKTPSKIGGHCRYTYTSDGDRGVMSKFERC